MRNLIKDYLWLWGIYLFPPWFRKYWKEIFLICLIIVVIAAIGVVTFQIFDSIKTNERVN